MAVKRNFMVYSLKYICLSLEKRHGPGDMRSSQGKFQLKYHQPPRFYTVIKMLKLEVLWFCHLITISLTKMDTFLIVLTFIEFETRTFQKCIS